MSIVSIVVEHKIDAPGNWDYPSGLREVKIPQTQPSAEKIKRMAHTQLCEEGGCARSRQRIYLPLAHLQ